ncbi:MAG: anti-sigma28 factor (negative regulator of flagellin synthesis) [Planctomycetota bacterium]|jgi:anti-sigma28 factor (negative regulator of flagellin synthesis)
MELRNTQGLPGPERRPDPAKMAPKGMEDIGEAIADVKQNTSAQIESTQASARRSNALTRAAHSDSLDLSEVARLFASDDVEAQAARQELVSELRDAYQNGTLNTQERMETAARRLLGHS